MNMYGYTYMPDLMESIKLETIPAAVANPCKTKPIMQMVNVLQEEIRILKLVLISVLEIGMY